MSDLKKIAETLATCRAVFNQEGRPNNGCFSKSPFETALIDLVDAVNEVVANQAALEKKIRKLSPQTKPKAAK